MEKLVIHKNKGEVFKCQLDIEGASVTETMVRLCLEFDDNKNFFFYGQVDKEGKCVIEVPKLKELENKSGKVVIEAVADSTYFKIYETEVELKNSVEVKMTESSSFLTKVTDKTPSVRINEIKVEKNVKKEEESTSVVKEEEKNPFVPNKKGLRSFNDWIKK